MKSKKKNLSLEILDISMEISDKMPVWKNKTNKNPKSIITAQYRKGKVNESRINMDLHTGTHVDAHFHMLDNGRKINEISLNKFIGECIVLDFTTIKEKITIKELKNKNIKNNDIVLLKTRKKSMKKFDFNYTYLEKSGAKFLATKNIKSVGIDGLGVEINQPGYPTHKHLLNKNISIIEGLDLSKIKPGRYFFIGLPLKIKDGDASPIRAVLVKK